MKKILFMLSLAGISAFAAENLVKNGDLPGPHRGRL